MTSPYKKMRQDQHLKAPQQEQQQQHPAALNITAAEFRDQAVSFLASRLMVSQHCTQAASLQLRPSLQKVQEELLSTITSAVQLKQNASLLVLGEPGIGKTLVSPNSLLDSKFSLAAPWAWIPACMLQ
jgi:DNA replication protein DnaC